MASVFGIELLCTTRFVKFPPDIRKQCPVFLSSLPICPGHGLCHPVIIETDLFVLLRTSPVSPGRKKDRDCARIPYHLAESADAFHKGCLRGDRAVAHFLQDHIIPVLLLQGSKSLLPQSGVRIGLLREPGAAPCDLHNFRACDFRQHGRHIICICKTVTEHQDLHSSFPHTKSALPVNTAAGNTDRLFHSVRQIYFTSVCRLSAILCDILLPFRIYFFQVNHLRKR